MKDEHIKKIVSFGHHEAIKHWLKINGIRPFTAATENDFYQLLLKHIGEGKLQYDQLRRLTLELNEYGQKRVYIGKLIDFKTIQLRQRFENHLKLSGENLSAIPERKLDKPARPHLDYICWSTQEVRIGYSETHSEEKPDKATRTWIKHEQTNYITISANPSSGAVSIIMDAPLETHPHQGTYRGEEVLGYLPYYRAKAIELLGVEDIKSLDFIKISKGIAHDHERFERMRAVDLTKGNSRITTVRRGEVTKDPAYTAGEKVDGDQRVYEAFGGYWLPEGSGNGLQRRIYMNLNRQEEIVQFPGINLAREVEYAISRIRAI